MALSPWPAATATVSLATATTTLKAAIDPNLDDARVQALGAAASALVEKYAPAAPGPIKDEATIRTAGYLHQQPAAAVRGETTGDIRTSFAPSLPSALRHSGSMALLSPWKVRRAGAIG